jgi:hypothetical protein
MLSQTMKTVATTTVPDFEENSAPCGHPNRGTDFVKERHDFAREPNNRLDGPAGFVTESHCVHDLSLKEYGG